MSHLDMLRKVVQLEAGGRCPYDEEVLKNKSLLDIRLYRTIRPDRRHGPNTVSRCAHDLVNAG